MPVISTLVGGREPCSFYRTGSAEISTLPADICSALVTSDVPWALTLWVSNHAEPGKVIVGVPMSGWSGGQGPALAGMAPARINNAVAMDPPLRMFKSLEDIAQAEGMDHSPGPQCDLHQSIASSRRSSP